MPADLATTLSDLVSELRQSRRDEARARADVLTPRQAAKRLPWATEDAVRWLRRAQCVCSADGREVVIWSDVLDALREGRGTPEARPVVSRSLRRKW